MLLTKIQSIKLKLQFWVQLSNLAVNYNYIPGLDMLNRLVAFRFCNLALFKGCEAIITTMLFHDQSVEKQISRIKQIKESNPPPKNMASLDSMLKYLYIIQEFQTEKKQKIRQFYNLKYSALTSQAKSVSEQSSKLNKQPLNEQNQQLSTKNAEQIEYPPYILKRKYQKQNERPNRRTLLSDRISTVLNKLCDGTIDQKAKSTLEQIFDPRNGINITKYITILQKQRFDQAANENKLYPLNPNSAIMKFVLDQAYEFDDSNGNLKQVRKASFVNYIVGTPGLGKTFKLLLLKHLHDLKTRYVIQHGVPKESIFNEQYKFFYVHALTVKKELIQQILQQVQKDFKKVPENIELASKLKFNKFCQAIAILYQMKKVRIKIIIDQVNQLYDNSKYKEQLEQYLQNLKSLIRHSGNEALLVSSRNNPFLRRIEDPIHRLSNSLGSHINFKKTVLDNHISPEDRLLYSMQCLLFELQKHGIGRDRAVRILRSVNTRFMTHNSIVGAMKEVSAKFKREENLNSRNNQRVIKQIISKKLDHNQAAQNLYKKIQKLNLDNQQMLDQQKQSLLLLCAAIGFSAKQCVKQYVSADLQIQHRRETMNVFKDITAICKNSTEKQTKLFLQHLTNANYFFITKEDDQQKIYASFSLEQLYEFRTKLTQHFSLKFISKMQKIDLQKLIALIKIMGGGVFELLFYQAYNSFKKDSINIQISTTINFKNETKFLFEMFSKNVRKQFLPVMQNQVVLESKKILPQKLDKINKEIKDKIQKDKEKTIKLMLGDTKFMMASPGNLAFDFMISRFDKYVLQLFLIDTTIDPRDENIKYKIDKFKAKLLTNQYFMDLVKKIANKCYAVPQFQQEAVKLVQAMAKRQQTSQSQIQDVEKLLKAMAAQKQESSESQIKQVVELIKKLKATKKRSSCQLKQKTEFSGLGQDKNVQLLKEAVNVVKKIANKTQKSSQQLEKQAKAQRVKQIRIFYYVLEPNGADKYYASQLSRYDQDQEQQKEIFTQQQIKLAEENFRNISKKITVLQVSHGHIIRDYMIRNDVFDMYPLREVDVTMKKFFQLYYEIRKGRNQ